jgi:hypothetical protein
MADFELADNFLPIYDVSNAVATVADADRETAWRALLDVDLKRGRTLGGARGRVRDSVENRILVLSELEHRGTGGGSRGLEQAGEWAGGHAGSDVLRVAGVLEQVCVDVERDGDAGVPEDAADLGRVEPEVDDQVAGEGVA